MIRLNLWDGQFEEWQQAGIISIKLAIDLIDKGENPYQFQYTIDDCTLNVTWQGDNIDAWDWLFKSYVQIQEGIIVTPFGQFVQHFGMLGTLLQIPKTRKKKGQNIKHFYKNNYGSVYFNYLELEDIIHYQYSKKLFTGKELFTPSWLIPNCVINPDFTISFKVGLASWFAFPISSFYQGKKENYLVVPIFKDLDIKVADIKTPDVLAFKTANIYDAAIQCLIDNPKAIGVKGFSYKHEKANRANKTNKIINVFREDINWESALQVNEQFRNLLFDKGDYTPFIKVNHIRGWLSKNLCENQPLWHDIDSVNPTDLQENPIGIRKMFFPGTCKFKSTEKASIDEPLVDDCDRHLLENHKWRKGKNCGWFRRYRENGKHKTIYLHREILNVSRSGQGIQIYFKNGDKDDCRRNNLEALSMSEFRKREVS